ncbi:MAG: UbiA family prenyltransferase [Saprospiraceae bacterium]
MRNLLKIFRWPNLIMLAVIQVLVYMRLLHHQQSIVSDGDLILLILITMLIAAGGYIINDYFDKDIDRINKPAKWIIGNSWSEKKALTVYSVIGLLGCILSIWLALRLGLSKYLFIYLIAMGGLWLYSSRLKCFPIAGNLWVALFCAAVIFIIALPDLILGNEEVIRKELWYYIGFAFLSTWFREVVKDLEDIDGDQEKNCRTFVVQFGLKPGKIMATILGLLLVVLISLWEDQQSNNIVMFVLVVLQGVVMGCIGFMWWSKIANVFGKISQVIKIVMLAGTLILLLI